MNNHLKEVSLKNWANPSEAPVRVGSCMALPTIARKAEAAREKHYSLL
jgi:hypothetical protein